MKAIVIGLGETGLPLYIVLRKVYPDISGFDQKTGFCGPGHPPPIDILNICIPYSPGFLETVRGYQKQYKTNLTIIHSTVPVGTTAQLENAVHSPILGDHTNMENSLFNFRKWIGGERAGEAKVFMSFAGIPCVSVERSEHTELLKLMCLAKYGMSIAFADYLAALCDKVGMDYVKVLEWDKSYNNHVDPSKKRPIITFPGGKIGGHCLTPGARMLNDFCENPILEEVLKLS